MVRPENGADRALELLARDEPIVAPDLIITEVCNAASNSPRRAALSPAQFEAIVSDVPSLSRVLYPSSG
jgi:predicted nucleic acid-binding protein